MASAAVTQQLARHKSHETARRYLKVAELKPEAIAPKAVRRRNGWFKPGKLSRTVLDVLRVAPAPKTLKEITTKVMTRRGLDPADDRTVHLIRKLVSNAVPRQAAELVEKITEGRTVTWRVRR